MWILIGCCSLVYQTHSDKPHPTYQLAKIVVEHRPLNVRSWIVITDLSVIVLFRHGVLLCSGVFRTLETI